MSQVQGHMTNPDDTPPRGGAAISLVEIANLSLEAIDVSRRVEAKLDNALRPVRREWYERLAVVVVAAALVGILVLALFRERAAGASGSRPDVVIVRGDP